MSQPGFDGDIIDLATREQDRAADPSASVFVEANAGSGKTRVLVNRVINILLVPTPPDRILCVTYTKAAAAEMKTRLFERLGRWSVMGDDDLRKALKALGRRQLDADSLAAARRLFAEALETPGGLKIQTIHAFCENLLRRFPLEAGAPPGFQTLDDTEAERVVERARRQTLKQLDRETVDTLLQSGGPDALGNILRWTRFNRHKLRDALEGAGGDAAGLIERLYGLLELAPDRSAAKVRTEAWEATPRAHLAEAVIALRNYGSTNDQKTAEALAQALAAPSAELAFELCLPAYFTLKGTRAKTLVTAGCLKHAPSLLPLFEAEAERLEIARDQVRAATLAEASAAAIRVAGLFLDAYDAEMLRQRALDFDDLIVLSSGLLSPLNAFSGWVGYKLDGRLAHALVDEAQDTAPRQWDMIRGLTAEFFAGKGVSEENRTLFIVGDEKQSIYSFQGAEPARFMAEGDALAVATDAAGLDFARPELDVSFRSAPEILRAVDQAFAPIAASAPETKFVNTDPARPFAFYHDHRAARTGMPGSVELWPAVPKPEKVEEKSIFDPVDAQASGSARDILARTIAGEIRAMIDRGDGVWEETDDHGFIQRPVRPKDIAILVWRRTGGFFEEVIRQLKLAQVPVAGADRMVLREQTVVKDLLALGRLAITPGDDLALAELLKSPFFDPIESPGPMIDDAALFDLVQTRRNTHRGALWNALFTSTDPRFAEAKAALTEWRNKADSDGLYDVYCAFLNARTSTGESRWARVLARLGEEARDPAEVFLGRALEHEREQGGAMASFIAALEREETQLKREMSTDRDEVQVMTVHASKGLERPVIILPDTTRSPATGKGEPIFAHPEAGLIWAQRKAEDPPVVAALRTVAEAKVQAEHGRLLYVALTRARDRLIVCGWKQGNGAGGKVAEDSWYHQLAAQWSGEAWQEFETPLSGSVEGIEPGVRLGAPPAGLGAGDRDARTTATVPDWALRPAASEAGGLRAVAPSRLMAEGGDEVAVISPLLDPGGHRFRRGEVIHKLLETLPDLEPARRREAAGRFVAAQPDIDETMRKVIVDETIAVLDHPDFAPLFGPGSRAEVGLTGTAPGLPPGTRVRGQVDRLVITDHEVLIIDYKTNRPPPEDVRDVAPVYLAQMAAYRALLRALHPEKTVRCALLWTDAARLMELPAGLMEDVLSGANS